MRVFILNAANLVKEWDDVANAVFCNHWEYRFGWTHCLPPHFADATSAKAQHAGAEISGKFDACSMSGQQSVTH
jgi:hypothetical protein